MKHRVARKMDFYYSAYKNPPSAIEKRLSVVFLDLTKAFDMVSHKHISEGLKRFRVDSHFIDAVVDLYTDARFDNLATEENEEADLIQEPISHNPHIPM